MSRLRTSRSPRRRPAPALAAATLLVALAACGRPAAGPAPLPEPLPEPVEAAPVAFAWSPGERRLTLESRAVVAVAGDTAEAQDTVVTTIHAVVRLDEGPSPRRLIGAIDSVAVRSGDRIPTPPAAAPLPIRFTGAVDAGAVVVELPADTLADCASPVGALLVSARELLPSLPPRLGAGSRWTDSTTTVTCRGGVLLSTTVVHRYAVQGAADDAGLVVVGRETSYALSGEGEQARERVTVAGQGTGTGTLRVDAAAGRLVGLDATSRIELTFTGAGRVERVVQDGTLSVRERPLER